MPALWQSSQRPMYVRTVWVDGFRHAILSHDDPYVLKAKKRRPHSSASTSFIRTSRLSHQSDQGVRKINFLIRSDRSKIQIRPEKSREYNIERLNLTDVDPESEDELLIKASPQPLNEFESCKSDNSNMKNYRLNRTARNEAKPNSELSDRVFQWLDLAGKIDLLAPDNGDRMNQPRHSWPEIQRRNNIMKSKTTIDVRKETVKISSAKTCDGEKQVNVIDRHDIYIPTSANTIENYARQSRNKSTPRFESTKTKENLNKTKTKDMRNNVMETRQKIVTERNAVEKQYADLVSKKLIPDVSKTSKRQVHIFIPEVPKNMNSVAASRVGSLLSQKT
ncbi:uncharacterized protein LOC128674761 [Plodia interpunctella]|uniref:uncharacterized protein LOC128674761 n=1 Tax=Plodia interpunctella TaxID=58824 RepID=UPI002368B22D|nr:uncharacterized protein LOC128674761 [Plodia interpunctella]